MTGGGGRRFESDQGGGEGEPVPKRRAWNFHMLRHRNYKNKGGLVKIPKRFKQYGQTIEVVRKLSSPTENPDRIAFASYRLNQIEMRPLDDCYPMPGGKEGHAFCHELVHMLFYHASVKDGDKWLHQDEDVVDRVAGLLHQALTTMEYEED